MGHSEKPSETIESLQRTAEVQRRELHQPDLALATLVKALELRPDDVALHRLAEEVAVEADAVDVLVELLGDLADAVEGPSRAALHKQLAGLHARHFPETGA
ncbi:MAG TPA: hypothetical protein VFB81_17665, partial [Myxococcales bacterium]|nr:hypothetical protein [Myxococcales bacterium]